MFQMTRRQFFQLILLYIIAHGGILFIANAVYWDDWTIFNTNAAQIIDQFKQSGLVGVGYFHVAMLSVGPWFYKLAAFVLSFFTGLFVWKIVNKQAWLNQAQSYYITLFFLITPCVAARVALIDFPYLVSVFFFFWAWSMMDRHRILSLVLFFLSFTTQSLLVFYALPILDWYCRDVNAVSLNKLMKWACAKLDFLLIPFVWFCVKIVYFKPYGIYSDYNNHYSLKSLLVGPVLMLIDFIQLNINLAWTILLCIAILFVDVLPQPEFSTTQRKILYSSLLALFFGLFPYLILGYVPTFDEWTSRHQLLMPLGLSLFFVWLIGLSKIDGNRKIYIALLISVSLVINIKNYTALFLDNQKQQALIEFVRHSSAIKQAPLVIVDDKTTNALNRLYRTYEWSGMLKLALGDQSHYGLYLSEVPNYDAGEFDTQFSAHYNAATHVRKEHTNRVILSVEKTDMWEILFHHAPLYKFSEGEYSRGCSVVK